MATEDFSSAIGSCAGGYSCIYANTISWRTPTMPLPMEINPRAAFERMFGRAGNAGAARGAAAAAEERSRRASAARSASSRAASAPATSSALDEYLQHLREVEAADPEGGEAERRQRPTPRMAPIGIPESHHDHLTVMFDLMALA